jgi:hypothetical protein
VLIPIEMSKDTPVLKTLSEINEKLVPETKENQVEIHLLFVGISLALVLIWCSVIGLCFWKKLSNYCRKENQNFIYDDAVPNEEYYYECPKCPIETKKSFFVKVLPNCNLSTLASRNAF